MHISCNYMYLKSPKPSGPSHLLLLLAKDNIFGSPIGAWFTLMEDDNHLFHLDLNSTRSNFFKNALSNALKSSKLSARIISFKLKGSSSTSSTMINAKYHHQQNQDA